MMGFSAQGERREFTLSLFVLSGPSVDCMTPIHIGEGDFFTQSTKSDTVRFQKHPHRHTQKQCLISYLSIPELSQVDT